MSTAGAIFNIPQTYGNGEVIISGSFSDNGSKVSIAHGHGWQIAYANTSGVYLVTLASPANTTLSWRSILYSHAKTRVPASSGDMFDPPIGYIVVGDLQSDGRTMYLYVYGSGDFPVSLSTLGTGVLGDFMLSMSTSIIND